MKTFLEMMNVWNKSLSLTTTTTELLFASMQTMTHRAAIVGTGSAGSENQLAEYHEMHIEKFETLTESSKSWISATSHVGEQWLNTITATNKLFNMQAAMWNSPQAMVNHNVQCVRNVDDYMSEHIRLSLSLFQLAESVLEPVHERVKGNIERLSAGKNT